LPVAFESVLEPRVGDVSGENNLAVTVADQVTRGMERSIEVIEPYFGYIVPARMSPSIKPCS
jgi:hypothetical protein